MACRSTDANKDQATTRPPIAKARKSAELNKRVELVYVVVAENEINPPTQKLAASNANTRNFSKFCLFPLRTWPRKVPMSDVIPEKWALRTRFWVRTEVMLLVIPHATAAR